MAGPQKDTTPYKRFATQAQNVFEEYGAEAHDGFDWAAHTEAVAADIFGACNEQRSRPPEDVRFGNKGSVSVNYTEGKWYDFENKRGGGIKELIRVYKGIEGRDEAIAYAKECLNGEKPSADGNTESEQQRAHAKSNKNGQQREHEATYIYHNADGQVAFEVVRFAFKETDGSYATDTKGKRIKAFSQRRPSGEPDGRWLWGLGAGEFMRATPGKDWKAFSDSKFSQYPARTRQRKAFDSATPMVPYRLPELLKALAANQTILIPEGEKKVERIRELGFPATCNAGGAKKWASEHTAYLRGADVVLLPDNDEVGREHMQTIANSISAVAKRVRILDLPGLPEKGDVVDWQGTAEEFAQLVAEAPDYVAGQRDQPQPLMRPLPPPEPFPIDALGPGLTDAARGIADIVQAPIEMCAGAVLGSASLAVSIHIDIELPTGETKPASLFLCPMAESGERKTTVDGYAFAAQQRFEQKLRVNRAAELETYRVRMPLGKRRRRRLPSNIRSPAKPVQRHTRRNWSSSAPNR